MNVGELIKRTIDLYKQHAGLFMAYIVLMIVISAALQLIGGAVFLGSALSGVASGSPDQLAGSLAGAGIGFVLILIVSVIISMWFSIAFMKSARERYVSEKKTTMGAMLGQSKDRILPSIGVSIVTGFLAIWPLVAILAIWSIATFVLSAGRGGAGIAGILNVILGLGGVIAVVYMIYKMFQLYFASYAVILDNVKVMESVKKSVEMVKGQWLTIFWKLLAPGLLFLAVYLLSLGLVALIGDNSAGAILGVIVMFAVYLIGTPMLMIYPVILYEEERKSPKKA